MKNPTPEGGLQEPKKGSKEQLLIEALQIISQDRPQDYGEASVNIECAAQLTTVYLANTLQRTGGRITAHDYSMIMILGKISRIACGEYKADNYVDLAGYAAIAGELKNATLKPSTPGVSIQRTQENCEDSSSNRLPRRD